MKRYCSKFVFTAEFIENSIYECLYHKTGKCIRWYRKDTSYFLAEYLIKGKFTKITNINIVAKNVRKTIRNNLNWYADNLIPYIAKCILEEIQNQNIMLKPIVYQERYDSSSLKLRQIGITSIKQQVYDYIIVNACKKMFLSKIGIYQCSSIQGRGQLYAKENIEKWIRKKYKRTRYITKFDVRKYYPSVKHDILFKYLERDIKNKDILYVLKTLISTYSDNGQGLCIGTYLSPYLANYFLSYAYHYILDNAFKIRKSKRDKCVKRTRLIYKVAFYMDDIILVGSNRKDLKNATHMMIKYLKSNLELELKHNQYQFIDLFKNKAFIDIVGYRIYKDHTIIRERIYTKIKRCMRTIRRNKGNVDVSVFKSFVSRHGYIKNSDSNKLKRRTCYWKLFNIARLEISNEAIC